MSNSTSTTETPPTSTEAPPSSPTTSSPSANTEPTAVTTSSNPFTTSSFTTSNLPPTTPPSSSTTPPTTSSPSNSAPTIPPTTSNPPQVTSFITTVSSNGLPPTTIVETSTFTPPSDKTQTSTSSSSTSSSTAGLAGDTGNGGSSGGLSGGGKTAVEVIVPIVVVALLVLAGLWFWRKRKQRKDAEEVRRKEVEEYGYNPNDDPTIPPVGGVKSSPGDGPFEMREDDAGYRGWGTTAVGSSTGRKASTTLSGGAAGGMAYSESTSPSHGPISDARSGDTLIGSPAGRPISDGPEEILGAMGPAAGSNRAGDMHRGPSNASSSYSAANRSDGSGEVPLPSGAYGTAQYYSGDANYGGPYADGSFGGGPGGRAEMSGQPVIRDNLARRATRIENPSHFPTQASAGIAQNF